MKPKELVALLLALIPSLLVSANARANSPDWTVNAAIGDASWLEEYGEPPSESASESQRLAVHLRHVHAMLVRRDVEALPFAAQARRAHLLRVLTEYAEAGRFPQRGADEYEGRRPKFIDAQGVHCAVGHLIASSGHAPLAQTIAHDENFAYVDEIRTSGLMAWATEHGFMRSELAMIQPRYSAPPTAASTRRKIEQASEHIGLVCAQSHSTLTSFDIRVIGEMGPIRVSAEGQDPFVECFIERVQNLERGGGAYSGQAEPYAFEMHIEARPPREVLRSRLTALNLDPRSTGCGPRSGDVTSWARVDVKVGRQGRRVEVRTAPRNVEVAQCLAEWIHAHFQLAVFTGGAWNLNVRLPKQIGPVMSSERLELERVEEQVEHLVVDMRGVVGAEDFEVTSSAGSEAFQSCVRDGVRVFLRQQFQTRRPNAAAYFRIDADVHATLEFDVETPEAWNARMQALQNEIRRYE